MATKAQIARRMYGESFDDLAPAEKAAVTKAFNKQGTSAPASSGRSSGDVKATIARIGVNGSRTCFMNAGATVANLLEQAGLTLDSRKEGVIARSTGSSVSLNTPVVDGEEYVITTEIKSA